MKEFQDKVAVITGGASGFGHEFAKIGARLGMKLVLADVQQDALDRVKAELEAQGAQVLAMRCDVRHAARGAGAGGRHHGQIRRGASGIQ